MTKISIIVPVYNVEKFLPRCLDSLINQTLKDIEIICINDGSTDSSLDILKKYAQKDNRIFILEQENLGMSIARNNGMKIAQGEYIGFTDSDDWVDLDFYEKLYNAAKKSDADIAAGEIFTIHKIKKEYYLKFKKEELITDISQKFLVCNVPKYCYVWNKIYKTDKLKELNLEFEPNVYYEDRMFTVQALNLTNSLITVPNTGYNYFRPNPNSIIKTKSEKKNQDNKYTNEKMINYIKSNNINIDHFHTKIKKFRLFGLTIAKIKYFKDKKEYKIFNLIKFTTKA